MRNYIFFLMLLAASWSGCKILSSDEPDDQPPPAIDHVQIVGYQISPNLQDSSYITFKIIPFDKNGDVVLSDALMPRVTIEDKDLPVNFRSVDLPAQSPLSVAVDIDASGSMDQNDPHNYRLEGAKLLVDVLTGSNLPFEAAVFDFYGSRVRLLQGFTSNQDSLHMAIDLTNSSGETPTYKSLQHIIQLFELEKPGLTYGRFIVLFSDGEPDDEYLYDETCRMAQEAKIPIFSIGLGPASDLTGLLSKQAAVQEMQNIAACSGGVYAGIDPGDVRASTLEIFNNIGIATTQGSLNIDVDLSRLNISDIEPGTMLHGELILSNGLVDSPPAPFSIPIF